MDIWVAFTFWLLWMMLQWIGMFTYLFEILPWSVRYTPRSKSARSYGSSIFNFLRNLYIILHNGYTIIFPPAIHKIPIPLHPCEYSFPILLIVAILIESQCCFIVILICISLMISDVEHLFLFLLAIHISSLENYLGASFAHFLKIKLSSLACLTGVSYILDD